MYVVILHTSRMRFILPLMVWVVVATCGSQKLCRFIGLPSFISEFAGILPTHTNWIGASKILAGSKIHLQDHSSAANRAKASLVFVSSSLLACRSFPTNCHPQCSSQWGMSFLHRWRCKCRIPRTQLANGRRTSTRLISRTTAKKRWRKKDSLSHVLRCAVGENLRRSKRARTASPK